MSAHVDPDVDLEVFPVLVPVHDRIAEGLVHDEREVDLAVFDRKAELVREKRYEAVHAEDARKLARNQEIEADLPLLDDVDVARERYLAVRSAVQNLLHVAFGERGLKHRVHSEREIGEMVLLRAFPRNDVERTFEPGKPDEPGPFRVVPALREKHEKIRGAAIGLETFEEFREGVELTDLHALGQLRRGEELVAELGLEIENGERDSLHAHNSEHLPPIGENLVQSITKIVG